MRGGPWAGLVLAAAVLGLAAAALAAGAPAPSAGASAPAARTPATAFPAPGGVSLTDDPEDLKGVRLWAAWQTPAAAPAGWDLAGFRVWLGSEGTVELVGMLTNPAKIGKALDGLDPKKTYAAAVQAVYVLTGAKLKADEEDAKYPAPSIVTAFSQPSWSHAGKPVGAFYDPALTNVLVGSVLVIAVVLITLHFAQRRSLYVRPIAGLQAVDDAIGRATEMGRPMLYVSGLGGISGISTIAAMLILGHLAKKTAPYGTPILVPCNDPLVMSVEQEIVREAYLEAGRPDAFRPEDIFYTTDSQFGYVAAVDGIIMREKPAANFFLGYFYAEALILGETGNIAGAMQIAGTDADTQLPFFITSCDYTLMGEELYAAGAYLSRHPVLVAQLKGQDIGKTILAAVLAFGVTMATLSQFGVAQSLFKLVQKALATD